MAIVTYDQADITYDEPTIAYGGRLANSLFIALDNNELNIGNFHISTIFHDQVSGLLLEQDPIARRDGTKLLSKNLSPKTIPIKGRIQDDTNTLEENIDSFKKIVNVSSGILDISYAGITRRYKVALSNLSIARDYFNIRFAEYSMDLIVLSGVGRDTDVTETLSVDDLTETTTSWEDINFGGSASPKPLIRYIIDTAGNLQTIQFNQKTTATQIEIGTVWSDGDVLEIDNDDILIRKNGSDVEFEGVFPRFALGDNDFSTTFISENQIDAQQDISSLIDGQGLTTQFKAQGFKPATTTNFSKIDLSLLFDSRGGNSNTFIEVQTDNAGEPSGTPVANGTSDIVTPVSLGSLIWVSFNFSTVIALTAGTQYWIVLKLVSDPTFSHSIGGSQNNLYPDGNYATSSDSGSSWTQLTSIDMAFRLFTAAIPTHEVSKKITYTKRYL